MKLKDILQEAFEGLNGVFPLGAIHNLDGFSNKKFVDNTKLNETVPAFPKEFKDFEKASVVYAKSIEKLITIDLSFTYLKINLRLNVSRSKSWA